MRYNPENGFVELDVNELLTSFGSIGTKTNSEKESIRTAKRDKLSFEHGIFFSPDAEFKFRINVSGIHYEIYGKADGILRKDGKIIVYIIRSAKSLRSVISLPPITEAKGLILSHFAAEKFSADTITLRTVIIETETGNESIIDRDFSASSLSRSFMGMLLKKERFAKLCINRATDARASIRNMSFPFGKMREGQRELIEECYRAIHSGKRLFASAPTGIGKTISVLYPSVKALSDGLCDKIFYLTAKGSTRREAFSSVKKMFDAGAELKVIMLSAKETMCANDAAKMSGERLGSFCPPDKCGLSRGYYSRNEDALYELLTMGNGYTPALISKVARKHSVCPYELSLDLSEHCDVIICDYNYVFDPAVKLRRYFGELSDKNSENYVFLTDEAHNLADRARGMYSAELDLSLFQRVSEELPVDEGKLLSHFEEFMRVFRSLKKLCADNLSKDTEGNDIGFYFSTDPPFVFTEALNKFLSSLENHSKKHRNEPIYEILYDVLSSIRSYLGILEYYDEHFRTYILVYGGDIKVKAYCIDPSLVLDKCMARACSSVLFSATLTPAEYFADVLGGSENAVKLSLPSPFPRENLCLCAVTSVSTRHDDRDKNAVRVAKIIAASVLARKGNYIAYFPSYRYMEQVAKYFSSKFPAVNIFVQKRGMSHAEKEEFLGYFKDDRNVLRIGFCVLGGSFSEGVDLPGSRLIGSIIVGVGLPQISNELNIIRDFYELKYEQGYDYAYTYPGMNKVLQACGRVIRLESDRGIVVLIDDRYATPKYKSLFPPHWNNINFASSASELASTVENFWQNENNM